MGLPQINESEFEKILVGIGHDGIKLIAVGIWKLCWYVKLMRNLENNLGLIDTLNPLLKERLIIFSKCIDCYEEPKTLEQSLRLINDFFDKEVENCKRKKSNLIDFIGGILELLRT